jgi:hypothetical protein
MIFFCFSMSPILPLVGKLTHAQTDNLLFFKLLCSKNKMVSLDV